MLGRSFGWVAVGVGVALASACGGSEFGQTGSDAQAGSSGSVSGGSSGTAGSGSGGTAASGGLDSAAGSAGFGAVAGDVAIGGMGGDVIGIDATAGSGGAATGGSGGGSAARPECSHDSQCSLRSDCCTCASLGPADPTKPLCDMPCTQTPCQQLGVNQASCVLGACSLKLDCNPSHVTCPALPTNCLGLGTLHSVVSSCWGPCVEAPECAAVPTCAACRFDQACVHYGDSANGFFRCVDPPIGCRTSQSCTCMKDAVCVAPYAAGCSDVTGPGLPFVACY